MEKDHNTILNFFYIIIRSQTKIDEIELTYFELKYVNAFSIEFISSSVFLYPISLDNLDLICFLCCYNIFKITVQSPTIKIFISKY